LLLDILHDPAEPVPTLIVLEDGHWFDSASWELLSHAARTDGILILLTTRPLSPEPPPYRELREDPGTLHLRLAGLGREETAAIAARHLAVNEVPDTVTDLIERTAAGNPYFTEQLALALRDLEIVGIRNGRCVVLAAGGDPGRAFETALSSRGLPGTVQGVVTSRLDRLTVDQQLSLKVGSVLGPR